MNRPSRNVVTTGVLLLATTVIGCSTTPETQFVRPDCDPAPRPTVDLDRRALWDALGAKQDDAGQCTNDGCHMFRRVDDTIDSITDWGLENEAVLKEACSE